MMGGGGRLSDRYQFAWACAGGEVLECSLDLTDDICVRLQGQAREEYG